MLPYRSWTSAILIVSITLAGCAQQPSTPPLAAIPDDQTTPSQPLMAQVMPDQSSDVMRPIELSFDRAASNSTDRKLSLVNANRNQYGLKECNVAPE
jgi:hypothetical protein